MRFSDVEPPLSIDRERHRIHQQRFRGEEFRLQSGRELELPEIRLGDSVSRVTIRRAMGKRRGKQENQETKGAHVVFQRNGFAEYSKTTAGWRPLNSAFS